MEDEETCGFHINKEYAKNYDRWREKEELQKLKDKYGDDYETSSSSSSEEEDEDAEALTPQLEKDWLRTLAALKSNNPCIYDKNVTFYKSASSEPSDVKEKKKKDKPMYIHDYERKVILEKGGMLSDEESGDDEEERQKVEQEPGYYEEQEQIRKSLLEAVDDDEDSDFDGDNLLQIRSKSKEEQQREEEDYMEWLKGQTEELSEENKQVGIELDPLRQYWSNPKLDEGEKFLRDYILNKGYLEEDEDRIPTYEEIVEENITDEEEQVAKEELFERKYNFRFEEPDPEFLKSYPRTLGESVRRKDDKRSKKRQEVKSRKEREKEEKVAELKQLKNLKKREILEKLEQIKEITGNAEVGFTLDDLDKDFDPKSYDRMMKKMFSEDYYDDAEEIKPDFNDNDEIDLELENWDEWKGPVGEEHGEEEVNVDADMAEGPYCDDPDFVMDADYDPDADRSYSLDPKAKKKRKKSKFAKAVAKRKPVFDPSDKTFEEYFDEYYKLDYEDIIGDLPCRFKYRSVVPNDFGLETEEILACKERELNQWASLKKTCSYRTEEEEKYDVYLYRKKARNINKKLHILTSLAEPEPGTSKDKSSSKQSEGKKSKMKEHIPSCTVTSLPSSTSKSRKNKRADSSDEELKVKRKKEDTEPLEGMTPKDSEGGGHSSASPKTAKQTRLDTPEDEPVATENKMQKSKNKKKKNKTKAKKELLSEERLKAYGINPNAFKYKHLPNLQRKAEGEM